MRVNIAVVCGRRPVWYACALTIMCTCLTGPTGTGRASVNCDVRRCAALRCPTSHSGILPLLLCSQAGCLCRCGTCWRSSHFIRARKSATHRQCRQTETQPSAALWMRKLKVCRVVSCCDSAPSPQLRNALPCTALHCTALHCTALPCPALPCNARSDRIRSDCARSGAVWCGVVRCGARGCTARRSQCAVSERLTPVSAAQLCRRCTQSATSTATY